MVPSVTCLYPREGNCHKFVPGPNGAAVLDMLFPLYNKDDGRECTYYKRRVVAKEDNSVCRARAHQAAGRLQLPWRIVRLLQLRSTNRSRLDNQRHFVRPLGIVWIAKM
jgi:hypothetical protein